MFAQHHWHLILQHLVAFNIAFTSNMGHENMLKKYSTAKCIRFPLPYLFANSPKIVGSDFSLSYFCTPLVKLLNIIIKRYCKLQN